MDIRHDSLLPGEDEVKNGKRRVLVVDLDGENDGEVKFLMQRLKNTLRSRGLDVSIHNWVEDTKGRWREYRDAWRKH